VVIDELDRHKESGNQTVRWRAGHRRPAWDGSVTFEGD
jgi:hypothetical protein